MGRLKIFTLTLVTSLSLFTLSYGDSEELKKFRSDYAILDQDLLNNDCEVATINQFVYQKDVATFTFSEGSLYLIRYVNDRPTAALFIGKGHATIDVPSHVEQQGLMYASTKNKIDESFEVCFMRIGDNFDLRAREKFTFSIVQMPWNDFNAYKKAQGEMHFRPAIGHDYDNYFQLLRSAYVREDDGYFWSDFNRCEFSFDPIRPEEVMVAYERKGGDILNSKGGCFQRKERGELTDGTMNAVTYPSTIVARSGSFDLSGLDGKTTKGYADIAIAVNSDSAKYLSLNLHYKFGIDSMTVDSEPTDFWRRRDFNFIGVILPKMYHKGDTLRIRMWYDGRNYVGLLPYVENPSRTLCSLSFTASKEFEYVMPDMTPPKMLNGHYEFSVVTSQPYNQFEIETYSNTFEKIPASTNFGLALNILKSPHINKKTYDCFVPDEDYRAIVTQAFNFLGARLGNPPNIFEVSVLPDGTALLPGTAVITQLHCIANNTGGFHLVAATNAARQWFGAQMRPASEREMWLSDALCEYLGLMFVQDALPGAPFYSELVQRRNLMDSVIGRDGDMPLGISMFRIPDSLRAYKGAWVMHMLRSVMLDLNATSNKDARFLKFLVELVYVTNNTVFSNADIQKIAEKHYGQPLDWFFNEWVYGRNFPEYKVNYSVAGAGTQFVVNAKAIQTRVGADFQMPVIIRVEHEDGSSTFSHQVISGAGGEFQLGPFDVKPKKVFFNEFFSVLSTDDVHEKK